MAEYVIGKRNNDTLNYFLIKIIPLNIFPSPNKYLAVPIARFPVFKLKLNGT